MPARGATGTERPWGSNPDRDLSGRRAAAARRIDQGIGVLRSLVPLAHRLTRLVGIYTAVVGAAALVIVATLLWRLRPASIEAWVAHVFVAVALLAPVVVLWLFQRALAEVVELPQRLAAVPSLARDHGTELAGLVRDARGRDDGGHLVSMPRDLWRAGRLLLAAHDDLPGYGAVLTLVSVPFLLVTAVSAVAGLVIVVSAPAVLAGATATALL
jgi:hypothetical protein